LLLANCYWPIVTGQLLLANCYWITITGQLLLLNCCRLSVAGQVLLLKYVAQLLLLNWCFKNSIYVERDVNLITPSAATRAMSR
jgi:hypothetical protein